MTLLDALTLLQHRQAYGLIYVELIYGLSNAKCILFFLETWETGKIFIP
jgi:glycerol-3-phosphate responsive antiterminator